MASQMSTPARRGVLSPLNVNTTIGSPSIGNKNGCAEEVKDVGEAVLRQGAVKGVMFDTAREERGVLGQKRGLGLGYGVEEQGRSSKRPKEASTADELVQKDGAVPIDRVSQSLGFTVRADEAFSDSSPAPSSPISSNGTSDAAVDDSQLTVPDDLLPRPRVVPALTPAELRQKAQAIKLRLRLASYKVRTNQVHIPMSRLEIRTVSRGRIFTSPSPSDQITLPSSSSYRPSSLQTQSYGAEDARQTISSSPPPKLCNAASILLKKKFDSPVKADAENPDDFATPLLPRHRHALLDHPKLGTAIWEKASPSKDLTSSVLKRGTADTLLSLKHQR